MFNPDPQKAGPQYLENLATGYWFDESNLANLRLDSQTRLAAKIKYVK